MKYHKIYIMYQWHNVNLIALFKSQISPYLYFSDINIAYPKYMYKTNLENTETIKLQRYLVWREDRGIEKSLL